MEHSIIETIASTLDALTRCPVGHEWHDRHHARLTEIEKNYLPSGSGIDCGTKIDRARSTASRIVFTTEFHHMNNVGMYDGWTEHAIIARPSFIGGFDLRVTGRDRNEIKDYLADVFDTALRETLDN